MAISHVLPLLLLLASLLFSPAFCAVNFEYCYGESGYDFGNISRVDVSPVPSRVPSRYKFTFSITVSGYTSEGLYGGRVEVSLEGTNHPVKADNLSDIEAGTNFVFTVSEVPYKSEWMRHYNGYAVTLFDDYLFQPQVLCVAFNLTTTVPTLVSA